MARKDSTPIVRIETLRPNGVVFDTESHVFTTPEIISARVLKLRDHIHASQSWEPRFRVIEVDRSGKHWEVVDATSKYLGRA